MLAGMAVAWRSVGRGGAQTVNPTVGAGAGAVGRGSRQSVLAAENAQQTGPSARGRPSRLVRQGSRTLVSAPRFTSQMRWYE